MATLSEDCQFIQGNKVTFSPGLFQLRSADLLDADEAARIALEGGPSWVNVTIVGWPEIVVFFSGAGVGCPSPVYTAGREETRVVVA